jgi:hypothetical protein
MINLNAWNAVQPFPLVQQNAACVAGRIQSPSIPYNRRSTELIRHANDGTMDVDTVVAKINDLYVSNDLAPKDLCDFYLLYFTPADLKEREFQYYWPDANRTNDETITRDRIREFIAEHENRGIRM